MRVLYGASDEKFVQSNENLFDGIPIRSKVDKYEYGDISFLRMEGETFNKNSLPIVFRVSPDTLLNLASNLVDKLPLPSVYEWTIEDVCRWIRKYGYPHYQNTFRVNLVSGRKLLLIDANALAAMNIKNFNDIKHIAYGIRQLFHFEMTKFMRSIALPSQYYYELYKLFRKKTGRTYDITKRTELWRRMQLIRESKPYLSHWETLEQWLTHTHEPESAEIIAGTPHYRLYECKTAKSTTKHFPPKKGIVICTCMPPCFCHHKETYFQPPTVFTLLKSTRAPDVNYVCHKKFCGDRMPPCTCHWKSANFKFEQILTCLRRELPLRYGPDHRRQTQMHSFMNESLLSRTTLI
uniref:Sterile alpha motif domain-containing protein 15 n=1 Tax=Bactrocera dorsalis TaxID=27457 RepID=A0A034WTI6_BACDO